MKFFLSLPRFWRYLITGGYNTAFSFALFVFLNILLEGKLHYIVILIINHFISVINSFLSMKIFVFKTRGNYFAEYLKCNITYLVSLGINMSMLYLLVSILSLNLYISQLACIVLVVVITYFMHQKFSFSANNPDKN
jgi:putative flippase GtrA